MSKWRAIVWVAVCGGLSTAAPTFTEHLVDPAVFVSTGVVATDIDGDGDADILVTAMNTPGVAWYESNGGSTPTFTKRVIAVNAPGLRALRPADLDGDGDLDIIVSCRVPERLAWLEQAPSADGAPGSIVFIERDLWSDANGSRRIDVIDFDGDGDLDVIAADQYGLGRVAWVENVAGADGAPPTFVAHVIPCSRTTDLSAAAGDLDGDGDIDVVVTSNAVFGTGWVGWLENVGSAQPGAAPSFVERTLAAALGGEHSALVTDFDEDGDNDVLCASFNGDTVSWFENVGDVGAASFVQRVVAFPVRGASEAVSVDVDGDGDLDAISAMYHDGEMRWHERTAGGWVSHLLRGGVINAEHVSAADMDGDGDIDPVGALFSIVTWYQNDGVCPGDANGDRVVNFADLNIVLSSFGTTGAPGSVPGDLNGDGSVNFADLNLVLSAFGGPC